jgi:hypothetical protein
MELRDQNAAGKSVIVTESKSLLRSGTPPQQVQRHSHTGDQGGTLVPVTKEALLHHQLPYQPRPAQKVFFIGSQIASGALVHSISGIRRIRGLYHRRP